MYSSLSLFDVDRKVPDCMLSLFGATRACKEVPPSRPLRAFMKPKFLSFVVKLKACAR